MDDINAAIHLVRSIDFVDDNTIDTKKLWQRIESDISVDTPKKVATIISLSRFRKIGLAVAACVALFIIFRPGFNSEKQIQTSLGQELTEVLPDGSEILINADSKICHTTLRECEPLQREPAYRPVQQDIYKTWADTKKPSGPAKSKESPSKKIAKKTVKKTVTAKPKKKKK